MALLPARPLRGGSCLSRHRAQCAGAETELLLGPHLLTGWHENKKLRVVAVCGMGSAFFTTYEMVFE